MNLYLTVYFIEADNDDVLRQVREARGAAWRRGGRRVSLRAVAHRAVAGVRRPTSPRQEPLREAVRS
jgi:hypothetical protein